MNIVTLLEELVNSLSAAEEIFQRIQRISIRQRNLLKHRQKHLQLNSLEMFFQALINVYVIVPGVITGTQYREMIHVHLYKLGSMLTHFIV